MTQPGQRRIRGHQSDGARTGEHRESLDGRSVGAGKPRTTLVEQECQSGSDVLGAVDAIVGDGVPAADLDSDVRPLKPAERLFVGHVVADEDGSGCAVLMANQVECVALVGGDDSQLDHRFALGDLNAWPECRFGADGDERLLGVVGTGVAYVQCNAGGLLLHRCPRGVGGDSAQLGDDLVEQFPGVGVDRVDESDVELGAVAADQLHFGGKSGQRSQILEGAARDHGSRRRREAGERAKRTHRFRPGIRLVRVGDDGCHRPVVVGGYEQTRRACHA